jgi:long-chain-fatty-acid--CoA ligase ACSBG
VNTGNPTDNLLPEAVNYFKRELNLDIKTATQAMENPKVIANVQEAIVRTNGKAVSRASHLRKFKLVSNDFSISGGELTPTMKLKRKVTEKKY